MRILYGLALAYAAGRIIREDVHGTEPGRDLLTGAAFLVGFGVTAAALDRFERYCLERAGICQ